MSLQRLCGVIRVLVVLGALCTLVIPVVFWSTPEWIASSQELSTGVGVTIDARAQWLGAAAAAPLVGVVLYALWQLWQLFGRYAAGLALTEAAQRPLQRFAWAVLAGALLNPVHRALLSMILTMGNPPGQRLLRISLSGEDYMQILLGVVLLAIARVMADAVRAAEENRGFV